jgi:hypothetical protein
MGGHYTDTHIFIIKDHKFLLFDADLPVIKFKHPTKSQLN